MAEEIIYDPTKSLLQDLENFGKDDQTLSDLQTNPAAIQLLLRFHIYNLYQLEVNKKELADEKVKTDKQKDTITNLRVKLAGTNERKNIVWLEIPISLLGGFAINILASDLRSPSGWLILLFVVIILVLLRFADIQELFQGKREAKDDG